MLAFYGIDFNQGHLRLTMDHQESRAYIRSTLPHPYDLATFGTGFHLSLLLIHVQSRILQNTHTTVSASPESSSTSLKSHHWHHTSLSSFCSSLLSTPRECYASPLRPISTCTARVWTNGGPTVSGPTICEQRSGGSSVLEGRVGHLHWGLERFDEWYAGCRKGWTGGLSEVLDSSAQLSNGS